MIVFSWSHFAVEHGFFGSVFFEGGRLADESYFTWPTSRNKKTHRPLGEIAKGFTAFLFEKNGILTEIDTSRKSLLPTIGKRSPLSISCQIEYNKAKRLIVSQFYLHEKFFELTAMNVAELLEKHRPLWQELEDLLAKLTRVFGRQRVTEEEIARFAQLYRSACADLALAESYKLPPGIVRYLNNLVGRAHNQLYCDQSISWSSLPRLLFEELPRRIFSDGAFWVGMLLFWVPFLACAFLAYYYHDDGFAERIVSSGQLQNMEEMYSNSFDDVTFEDRMPMVGFYIFNNAGIGLQCFAAGAFFMVTGVLITLFNAIYLGTIFGHMATTDVSGNFYEFVVAHGPFELTAIAMAAGAGLRIGFALISTKGYDRMDSMKRAARYSFPIIMFSVFLFCCAACIEAFISPSPLEPLQMIGVDPVHFKRGVCVLTALMLFSYIVVLGGVQWLRSVPEKEPIDES